MGGKPVERSFGVFLATVGSAGNCCSVFSRTMIYFARARVYQIADQRTARYPVTFALHIALLLEHNRCCVDVAPANDFVGDQVSGSRDEETTSGSGLALFRFCHFSCTVFRVASLVPCKIMWFKIAPVLYCKLYAVLCWPQPRSCSRSPVSQQCSLLRVCWRLMF